MGHSDTRNPTLMLGCSIILTRLWWYYHSSFLYNFVIGQLWQELFNYLQIIDLGGSLILAFYTILSLVK
jgi:hypothetical protein